MSINVTNERKIPYAVFDVNLTPQEAATLRELGWQEIQKDDEALIQYAMEHVLKEFAQDLKGNVDRLETLVKKEKQKKS